MPRGEELRQQLQQSGAIDRAGAWFEQEVPKLGLTLGVSCGGCSRAPGTHSARRTCSTRRVRGSGSPASSVRRWPGCATSPSER